MEEGVPDEQLLMLDLHAIRDEEWEELMESQLSRDELLAAVLSTCHEKESRERYTYEDDMEDDNLLYAAEDEE